MSRLLKIGELASRAGVSVATVRFYERKGLLPKPDRNEDNNYRTYTEDDLEHVAAIKRQQALGFTLREIRRVIELKAKPPGGQLVDLAKAKLAEVEVELKRAGRARLELRRATTHRNAPAAVRRLLLGGA